MSRFPELSVAELTAEQRTLYDRIANGPREGVRGPLAIWLRSPGFAERAEALGVYCRFDSSLSYRSNEIAILIVVAHWRARFAWNRHLQLARDAGLSETAIESIRLGRDTGFVNESDRIVRDFATELVQTRTVRDETWEKAMTTLGEAGVVDLIGIVGYYSLVAMTLVASKTGAEEDDPFPVSAL